MKRPIVNITPTERAGRVLVGLVGVIGGLASGAGLVVLEVLLVLGGLDMIVTGALGHCPLYAKLGHIPESLKGSRHERAPSARPNTSTRLGYPRSGG